MNFDQNQAVDLSRFETAFQAVRTNANNDGAATAPKDTNPVPDGTYRAAIEDVQLGTSPSSGNPQLKWMLRIVGPTHQRRVLYKRSGITEKSLPYLVEELKRCGITLQNITALERNLPNLMGLEVEVAKKTKGDMTNIYINKLLSAPAGEVDEDGVPF